MQFISYKNHPENEDFFKRYVKGARLGRGRNISSKKLLNVDISTSPIHVLVNMQGSQNRTYIIHVSERENGKFSIVHDCPDFKKGFKFCKHIVKTLLILEKEMCKKIFEKRNNITFSSKMVKVKETKQLAYKDKAEKLLKQKKYLEAINYYEKVYQESKNPNIIKRIIEIAISNNLPHQALKYVGLFEKFILKYQKDLADLISKVLLREVDVPFANFIDTLFIIQELLSKVSDTILSSILKSIKFNQIKNPLYSFIILQPLYKKESLKVLSTHYNLPKNEKFQRYEDLKEDMENRISEALKKSILDMESKEVVNAYRRIFRECDFKIDSKLRNKYEEHLQILEQLYRGALHKKHAALRTLVISNTNNDTLKPLKFNYRYRYPTLLWTNAKKGLNPLYYFVLEKCGLSKINLNYLNIDDFVENYPIFFNLFNANNPLPEEIKRFWKEEDYSIKNTVYLEQEEPQELTINIKELDKYILIEWDLAQKPILGSYICQFSQGYLIPEKNNPLTNEIRPFDLILCLKKPLEIKKDNVQIYRPLRRINIRSAISLVYKGLNFVSSYIPLYLVKLLRNHKIDEIEVITRMNQSFDKMFFPRKEEFKELFQSFIEKKISVEYNQFYLDLLKKPENSDKILTMLGFDRYQGIFKNDSALEKFKTGSLKKGSLDELRYELKRVISQKLIEVIKSKDYENINLFQLKKFPEFRRWTAKVIFELKQQLLGSKIVKLEDDALDVSKLAETYYGRIILEEAGIIELRSKENAKDKKIIVSKKDFEKIIENYTYLNLNKPKLLSDNFGPAK